MTNRVFKAIASGILLLGMSSCGWAAESTDRLLIAQMVLPVMQKELSAPESEPIAQPASIQLNSLPEDLKTMVQQGFMKAPATKDLSSYPAVDPQFAENKTVLESLPVNSDGIAHVVGDRVIYDYRVIGLFDQRSPYYGVLNLTNNTAFIYNRDAGKLLGVEVYDRSEFPRVNYTYMVPKGELSGLGVMTSLDEGFGFTPNGKMICHYKQGRCFTETGAPLEQLFAGYIKAVQHQILAHWKPNMQSHPYAIMALFNIDRNGHIADLTVKQSNASKSDEALGLAAIRAAAPFPALPKDYPFGKLQMHFGFVFRGGPPKNGVLVHGKNNKAILLRDAFHK